MLYEKYSTRDVVERTILHEAKPSAVLHSRSHIYFSTQANYNKLVTARECRAIGSKG